MATTTWQKGIRWILDLSSSFWIRFVCKLAFSFLYTSDVEESVRKGNVNLMLHVFKFVHKKRSESSSQPASENDESWMEMRLYQFVFYAKWAFLHFTWRNDMCSQFILVHLLEKLFFIRIKSNQNSSPSKQISQARHAPFEYCVRLMNFNQMKRRKKGRLFFIVAVVVFFAIQHNFAASFYCYLSCFASWFFRFTIKPFGKRRQRKCNRNNSIKT